MQLSQNLYNKKHLKRRMMIELISLYKIGVFFYFFNILNSWDIGIEDEISKKLHHSAKIKYTILAPWCYFRIFTVFLFASYSIWLFIKLTQKTVIHAF